GQGNDPGQGGGPGRGPRGSRQGGDRGEGGDGEDGPGPGGIRQDPEGEVRRGAAGEAEGCPGQGGRGEDGPDQDGDRQGRKGQGRRGKEDQGHGPVRAPYPPGPGGKPGPTLGRLAGLFAHRPVVPAIRLSGRPRTGSVAADRGPGRHLVGLDQLGDQGPSP